MKLTKHASERQQQRSIPKIMIDLIVEFGAVERAGTDARKYYFDKTSRRRVRSYAVQLSPSIEGYLDYYVVVSDSGNVITVAPRIKRIKH